MCVDKWMERLAPEDEGDAGCPHPLSGTNNFKRPNSECESEVENITVKLDKRNDGQYFGLDLI